MRSRFVRSHTNGSARVGETAFFPESFPTPQAIVDLAWKWKAKMVGEHASLSAVMSVVGNHVGEHGDSRRPRAGPGVAAELFDAAA